MNNKLISVLLIEDNPGDARLIREILAEKKTAFNLVCVDRLSTGLECLVEGDFDVVLLDLSLPDSQGLDTFAKVHTGVPDLPIVVLSSLTDETLGIKAVADGAQDYLIKGQVEDNLLARAIYYAIERKRAETERENLLAAEREQRLLAEILAEVTLTLTSQLNDTTVVLDEILRQVQRLVPYKTANIVLLEGQTLHIARWQGYETFGGEKLVSNLIQPLSAFPVDAEAVQTRKLIVILDTHLDPRWVVFDEMAWIRSNLVVPICLRDSVLGLLRLDGNTPGEFSAEDGRRLQPLANAAAIALENARLFEETHQQATELSILLETARVVSSTLDLEEVLALIAAQMVTAIGVSGCTLSQWNQAADIVMTWIEWREQGTEWADQPGKGYTLANFPTTRAVLEQCEPISIRVTDPDADPAEVALMRQMETVSLLMLPLAVGERVIGLVELDEEERDREFTPAEINLCQALLDQAAMAIQNAQLFEMAKQHVAELEAVRQANLSLASSLELEAVLGAILESTLTVLNEAQNAHIFLYQAERLTFGAVLWADGRKGQPVAEPRPHGLTYTVARQGQPIVVPDMRRHPLYADAPADWEGAIVGLPLKIGQQAVGVMNISYPQPRSWPEAELRVLSLLADQAAIAIQNARLYEQAQREIAERRRAEEALQYRLEFEELIAAISTNFINLASAEIDSGINQALQTLGEFTGVDRSYVFLFSEDGTKFDNTHEWCAAGIEPQIDNLQGLSADILPWWIQKLSRLETIYVPRVADLPPEASAEKEILEAQDIQSVIVVPMVYAGSLIGFLGFDSVPVERTWSEDIIALLKIIGEIFANALERKQAEAELNAYRERLEAFYQMAQMITAPLQLDVVLDVITRSTADLLASDTGVILLLDEAEETLSIKGAYGLSERVVKGTRDRVGESIAGRVVQTGEPIIANDLPNDPRFYNPSVEKEGLLACASVPLTVGEKIIGTLDVHSKAKRHAFNEDHIRTLNMLASQAAIAIENARLYEALQWANDELEMRVQARTIELERAMVDTAEARDRIDAILRSVADGLIVTDLEHKVILANPAAEALLGFRLEQMLGRDIGTGIKDNQLREIVRNTLAQRASSDEIDIEPQYPNDIRPRVMRARTALVDDRQGQPLGTVTIIQDVTRLREVDRLKTDLLTTAAHELRTPLTSILGFSEILLTRELDQVRQQSYLRMINEQSAHLAQIIADLLDVSRLETGRGLDLKLEPVDMAELMQKVVMPFAETATEHYIQVEGLAKLPSIKGDPFRLAQVGRNLLSNAIKYSPQGGPIAIRGQVIPDYLKLSVQDQGIGMTTEQQEHLFEPFYRVDTSHTAIGGTGLGLAICKLIIDLHGGQIWVESQHGVGTTVYFTLPLVEAKMCQTVGSEQ